MGLLSRSGWSRRLTDIHKMSQSLCPSNFWEPPLTVNALCWTFTWDQVFLYSMPIPKVQAYISSKYLQNVGYYLCELVQFSCFDISCKPFRYYLLIYLSTLLEDSKRFLLHSCLQISWVSFMGKTQTRIQLRRNCKNCSTIVSTLPVSAIGKRA